MTLHLNERNHMKRGLIIGVLVALALSATVAGASNTKAHPTLDAHKFCATVEAHGNYDTVGDLTVIRKKGHKRFCITGTQGARGEQGVAGSQGGQGIPGTSSNGSKGDKGDTGSQGIAGPQGPKGDAGAQGSVGPAGPAGPQGPAGPSGSGGGEQGPAGPTGPTGPQGSKGDPGTLEGVSAGVLCVSNGGNVKWGGADGSGCDPGHDTLVKVAVLP
jgi:collagen triple helix repeat protein